MKLNLMIISLLLVNVTLQQGELCQTGCLACKANKDCLICDFQNKYILQTSKTCLIMSKTNCAFMNPFISGSTVACMICESGFFVDAGNCVSITVQIANCSNQKSQTQCTICSSGYHLSSTSQACESVTSPITNCLTHTNLAGDKCSRCLSDKVLSVDQLSCEDEPANRFCLQYSHTFCNSCSTSSALNQNNFVSYYFNLNTASQQNYINIMAAALTSEGDLFIPQICQSFSTSNCSAFSTSGVCTACVSGYYLDSKNLCTEVPETSIQNCISYSGPANCFECASGYHLSGSIACVLNTTTINDCLTYDGTATTVKCKECSTEFRISGNSCVARVNTNISSCATYSVSLDRCATCNAGTLLTTDGLLCLSEVANCSSYSASSSTTTALTCLGCASAYYLSAGVCQSGTITHCLTYNQSQTTQSCLTCDNSYYLASNVCNAHTNVPSLCAVTSNLLSGRCTTCDFNAIHVDPVNGCVAITLVTNCATYSSPTQCLTCDQGYQLAGNACTSIPTAENCFVKNGAACTLCKSGYNLANGVCYLPEKFSLQNCDQQNIVSTSGLSSCDLCSTNHYPIVFPSVCLENQSNGITNCQKYSGATCTLCIDGFVLSNDLTACLSECPASQTLYISDFDSTGTNYAGIKHLQCVNSVLNGCALATKDTRTGDPVCVTCKATFTREVSSTQCPELSLFKSNVSVSGYEPADFGMAYAAVDCTSKSTSFFPNDATYCDFFSYNASNDAYYCQKCKFGYTGPIVTETSGSVNVNYVNCGASITNCQTEFEYGGFSFNNQFDNFFGTSLAHLFSCHKCSSGIPFVHLSFDANLVPYGLEMNTPKPTEATSKNGNMVECRGTSASDLVLTNTQMVDTFIANCALGYYAVDLSKQHKIGSVSIFCAACKPGFQPNVVKGVINSCVQIANCNTSTGNWFNNCSTCSDGFTWGYTNDKVVFSECVSTTDPNCLAQISGGCQLCKKGYNKNRDNVCEKVTVSMCSSYTFNQQVRVAGGQSFLAQYLMPMGTGCNSCDTGSQAYNISTWGCSSSPYLTATTTLPNNTNYIPNCSNYYGVGSNVLCGKCNSTHLLSENGLVCHATSSNANFLNCLTANNAGNQCSLCATNFVLVNGACSSSTILNCATYNHGAVSLVCLTCSDGFYLSGNTCVAGTLENCQIFNSNGICTSCKANFAMVTYSSANDLVCLEISPELNCLSSTVVKTTQDLTCLTCNANYHNTASSSLSWPSSACLPLIQVPNCIKYNNSSLNDNLQCSLCADNYYLNQNACTAHNLNQTGCATLSTTSNLCATCDSSYYLLNGLCKFNPSGTSNCTVYDSTGLCTSCGENYYLNNSVCTLVDPLITQCSLYSDNATCSTCKTGFFLQSNTCTLVVASNCLTVTDINTCATCSTLFGLQTNTTSGITNCVAVSITSCVEATQSEPFECTQCNSSTYVDAGACSAITTTITGCEVYSSAVLCSKCAVGRVLSSSKDACNLLSGQDAITFLDCADTQLSSSPVCTVCNFGYIFDTGICVACSQHTLESGCLYCDPSDQTLCIHCAPGFQALTDGSCQVNPDLVDVTPTPNPTSVERLFVLALLAFSLLF